MHDLERCKSLRPFCELAYTTVDTPKPDEGYEHYDTAKYSRPKYGADKVIGD